MDELQSQICGDESMVSNLGQVGANRGPEQIDEEMVGNDPRKFDESMKKVEVFIREMTD